ncbi:3-ketoacyl-CoA thiolase [Arthrobacter sp. Hiyo8]|nr:3-ketoacyl-CoA thiolase [Arthrobacter sp. Hiyo8]
MPAAAHSASAPHESPVAPGTVRKAVVVGGNRIPFARTGGAYTKSSNQDMLTAALDGLIARFGLQEERIGEVAAGAVLKHSRDFNLTREAVLGSALSPETPAYDLQQACATGLETVLGLANKIKLGQIDSAIAGGVDSASDARLPSARASARSCSTSIAPSPCPIGSRSSRGCVPRTSPRMLRTQGNRVPASRWENTRR